MLSSWNPCGCDTPCLSLPKWLRSVPHLTVDVKGPEAVSPFEQLEPVQAGLYPFVYTHGGYHSDRNRDGYGRC